MYRIKDEQIDQWIEAHKEQMLEDICELIRIRSVSAYDPNSPERPFGEGCAKVLLRALELCERRGFRTRNYDFYCGTAVLPGTTSSSDPVELANHIFNATINVKFKEYVDFERFLIYVFD